MTISPPSPPTKESQPPFNPDIVASTSNEGQIIVFKSAVKAWESKIDNVEAKKVDN